jgi:hypothetical protein
MPHPYATDSDERKNVIVFLVLLSTGTAVLVSYVLNIYSISIPNWAEGPSILFVFGILYTIFKRRIWRAKLLHNFGVVKTPVLAGRWTGFVISSHDGHKERRDVTAQINQDWTDLVVKLKGRDSHSFSISATLLTGDEKLLSYEYQNEPHAHAPETMHSHRGQTRLTISEDLNQMDGDYYSGRDRQNFGLLHLKRSAQAHPRK